MNQSKQKRLQLVSDAVFQQIYALPEFTEVEQRHFFTLPDTLVQQLKFEGVTTQQLSSKLYYLLQFGYFKAKHLFFTFRYDEVVNDAQFILALYFPDLALPNKLPSRTTQAEIKKQLLSYFQFDDAAEKAECLIAERASILVTMMQEPEEIFHDLVKECHKAKCVLPRYSTFQDAIGAALIAEENRLAKQTNQAMTKEIKTALDHLLEKEENYYRLTEIQFDAKSFAYDEMQTELEKFYGCQAIYHFSQTLLLSLSISRKNTQYYGQLAKRYTTYRLKKLPGGLAYLYLICYIHERYERLSNNLIQAFCFYVDKYEKSGKTYAKKQLPDIEKPFTQKKQSIGELLKIYTDKNSQQLSGEALCQQAFNVLPEEEISSLSEQLIQSGRSQKTQENQLIWAFHQSNHAQVTLNLRPLFCALQFEDMADNQAIAKVISFLKQLFSKKKSLNKVDPDDIPIDHITPKQSLNFLKSLPEGKRATQHKKVINASRYEFYLYKQLRHKLKQCKVVVDHSIDYKSFDKDIKKPKNWKKEQTKILKKINNPILSAPIDETLDQLEATLEPLILRANQRILSGENTAVKVTHHLDGRTTWILPYPKQNLELDNPFYDECQPVTISEAFDFVQQDCQFARALKHIKPYKAKVPIDYLACKGAILANGTMQSTHEFSKKSNLSYNRMQLALENNIRLDTLKSAGDIIVDKLVMLPYFQLCHLGGKQHGNIDGKKAKTKRKLLRARHSSKYFGTDPGFSILSMTLNHIPFSTQIIGANEHESHYSYAMLMNNQTLIDPDIISTDTAGTNNINDFLFYMLGKTHAAHYRSTVSKVGSICGFKASSHYKDLLIQPKSQVDKKLIRSQWEEIQPILAGLLSHDAKQEIIVRKLSSHEFVPPVKAALWELNHIVKSIHLLNYVDDPQYRQYIRTALNRGEAYNGLIERIRSVGGGDFRGMSEIEIDIWNECTRLIALVILYYNTHLLSRLCEIKQAENDQEALDFLKHISSAATQHINIDGLYEFSEGLANLNLEVEVENLNQILNKTLKR